ncbi:MAG: acetyl-CoA carboxylase carboxyltransferase subunit beta, partial [Novosphingobium sp.]|nr:acetyl-CoA carboxylase carboxyltransferase subunit beta [Novosphingobium sp.]
MSWLTRIRKSIPFGRKRETADNLWVKCPNCSEMLFAKDYEENLFVCPRCEHHGRVGADTRLAQVLDPGYTLLTEPKVAEDPLKFRDSKRYADRIKAARAKSPHEDAFQVAVGAIEGHKAVAGVQDFTFMGGSMGMAVGQAFVNGAQRALDEDCAYIVFTAAGGARMQEGILSLMQMPKATVMTRR